jgi:hypothetical protein
MAAGVKLAALIAREPLPKAETRIVPVPSKPAGSATARPPMIEKATLAKHPKIGPTKARAKARARTRKTVAKIAPPKPKVVMAKRKPSPGIAKSQD